MMLMFAHMYTIEYVEPPLLSGNIQDIMGSFNYMRRAISKIELFNSKPFITIGGYGTTDWNTQHPSSSAGFAHRRQLTCAGGPLPDPEEVVLPVRDQLLYAPHTTATPAPGGGGARLPRCARCIPRAPAQLPLLIGIWFLVIWCVSGRLRTPVRCATCLFLQSGLPYT